LNVVKNHFAPFSKGINSHLTYSMEKEEQVKKSFSENGDKLESSNHG
jgi:hypothetical protein